MERQPSGGFVYNLEGHGSNDVMIPGFSMYGTTKRAVTYYTKALAKELEDITFYDVYRAVSCVSDEGLFHFHEKPNMDCPVGRNIHKVLDEELLGVQNAMEAQMKAVKLSDIVNKTRREIANEANLQA